MILTASYQAVQKPTHRHRVPRHADRGRHPRLCRTRQRQSWMPTSEAVIQFPSEILCLQNGQFWIAWTGLRGAKSPTDLEKQPSMRSAFALVGVRLRRLNWITASKVGIHDCADRAKESRGCRPS